MSGYECDGYHIVFRRVLRKQGLLAQKAVTQKWGDGLLLLLSYFAAAFFAAHLAF